MTGPSGAKSKSSPFRKDIFEFPMLRPKTGVRTHETIRRALGSGKTVSNSSPFLTPEKRVAGQRPKQTRAPPSRPKEAIEANGPLHQQLSKAGPPGVDKSRPSPVFAGRRIQAAERQFRTPAVHSANCKQAKPARGQNKKLRRGPRETHRLTKSCPLFFTPPHGGSLGQGFLAERRGQPPQFNHFETVDLSPCVPFLLPGPLRPVCDQAGQIFVARAYRPSGRTSRRLSPRRTWPRSPPCPPRCAARPSTVPSVRRVSTFRSTFLRLRPVAARHRRRSSSRL